MSRPAFALFLGFSLLTAAPVRAESKANSEFGGKSKAENATAQTQYRKAYQLMRERKWPAARQILSELWAQAQTYDVAASLSQVDFQLGAFASSAEYMSFALSHVPPKEKVETVQRYRTALAELKTKVGTVTILVNRPDAEVSIDGRVIGQSPLSADVFVDPGARSFAAQLAQGLTQQELNVEPGKSYRVELDFPEQDPSLAQDASLRSPRAVTTGFSGAEAAFVDRRRNFTPAIVTGAVAGAGLISGLVLLVAANKKSEDADSIRESLGGSNPCGVGTIYDRDCSNLRDLSDDAATLRAVSYASFGAALAAGVVTYVLWPKAKRPPSMGLAMIPGPAVAGGASVQAFMNGAF
ncbi:MAG TPA: hypothetical protein VFQ61_22490 [Polyangiaceae bacterium]|nr:hypothetical protein [Polyangiaceae bacterium]